MINIKIEGLTELAGALEKVRATAKGRKALA
jgi:hypothetical protein